MPPPSTTQRQTRVLCIDDNVDTLECLQSFLETFGYFVQVTTSGTKGIELVASWEPDIVIVDYNMPAMNGHQVAREIRRIRSDVAIIVLSGTLDIPVETLPLVDAFLEKNDVASRLLPTIASLVCRLPGQPSLTSTLMSRNPQC